MHSSVGPGAIGVLVGADALDQIARTTLATFADNLETLLRRAQNAAA